MRPLVEFARSSRCREQLGSSPKERLGRRRKQCSSATRLGRMSRSGRWGQTPRQSVERLCASRGEAAVVSGCVALLEGADADVDGELVVALGGPPARWALTGEPSGPDYWLRTWAARGLLYAWNDEAVPAVLFALRDEAWRVREMAAKVVARRHLDEALGLVADLQGDENARVRAAASRALATLAKSSSSTD